MIKRRKFISHRFYVWGVYDIGKSGIGWFVAACVYSVTMVESRQCAAVCETSRLRCHEIATSPVELLAEASELVYCRQHYIICHRQRIREYQQQCQELMAKFPWIADVMAKRMHDDLPHRWHITLSHLPLTRDEVRAALRLVKRCFSMKKLFQWECVAPGCGRRNHEIFTEKLGLLQQGLRLWCEDQKDGDGWQTVKSRKD